MDEGAELLERLKQRQPLLVAGDPEVAGVAQAQGARPRLGGGIRRAGHERVEPPQGVPLAAHQRRERRFGEVPGTTRIGAPAEDSSESEVGRGARERRSRIRRASRAVRESEDREQERGPFVAAGIAGLGREASRELRVLGHQDGGPRIEEHGEEPLVLAGVVVAGRTVRLPFPERFAGDRVVGRRREEVLLESDALRLDRGRVGRRQRLPGHERTHRADVTRNPIDQPLLLGRPRRLEGWWRLSPRRRGRQGGRRSQPSQPPGANCRHNGQHQRKYQHTSCHQSDSPKKTAQLAGSNAPVGAECRARSSASSERCSSTSASVRTRVSSTPPQRSASRPSTSPSRRCRAAAR